MMTTRKMVSSRHKKTDAHPNSQTLRQHTEDVHRSKPDKIPSPGKKWAYGPTLTNKLFAKETSWKREKQYSSMECHQVCQPCFTAGPIPGTVGQNKMDSMVLEFVVLFLECMYLLCAPCIVCFVILCLIGVFCLLVFIFFFFSTFETWRDKIQSWMVREVERICEGFGEGKEYNKNILH